MESGFHGVPLSTTQMAPKAAPFHNTTTTTTTTISGIRAPLTVDESDFEYSVSSKSRINSTCSSYYSESDGFVTGEDEFETCSEERIFVHDLDEEIITEETHFHKEYAFSRSFVKNPNGDMFQENDNNSNKYGLDGEIVQENALFSGKVFSRPYVRSLDRNINNLDEYLMSGSDEELVEDDDSKPLVPINNEKQSLENMPIAKISGDSDDDSQGSEILEDDNFSGIALVPSIELLQRINSAPKIRLVDLEEEEDNEVEPEFSEDVVVTNSVVCYKDEEEEEIGLEEETIHSVILADMSQDEGLNATQEVIATSSLGANEECNILSELEENGDFMHLDEEIQGNDVTKCVERPFEIVEVMEPEVTENGKGNNLVLNQGIENDKLENKIEEQNIDHRVDLLSFIASNEIEYVHQGVVDIKEAPNKALIRTDHIDIYNIEDSMTCASNNEAENRETEHLTFPPESKLIEAEIESEQASTSLSGVENLQEIDGIEARTPNNFTPLTTNGEIMKVLSEGEKKKKLEKIQEIRVKYLSFLHRLCKGLTEDSIAAKVLYLLTIAEGRYSSQEPVELEIPNNNNDNTLDDISFSILVIGKTGVGKSATINSILGENKIVVDAFEPSTTAINEIISTIDGVKVKIIDTPGLKTSLIDGVKVNRKILLSIKKLMQKSPPDVVLYVDRLNMQTGNNFNDLPLLKSINSYLGFSIWRKSIVILTHATSILPPPDGPNGYPLSYELVVSQRSRALQHLISLSVKEHNTGSLVPVSLVENHPFVKKNEDRGDWKSKLLLLCYSVKTLSEVNSVITTQNNHKKLFGLRRGRDLQSQFSFGRDFNVNVGADLNKMLSGKISINDRSLDQVQIVVIALLPIVNDIFKKIFPQATEDNSR